MTSLAELYRLIRLRLSEAGLDSAALDARLLVEHATGRSTEDIVCRPALQVSIDQADVARLALARRLAGEPVHRILGRREFYGLGLSLSSETLEPRPDTETVVDLALDWARRTGHAAEPLRILDLGTGTGAIALALLSQLSNASATLTDVSADALATARRNAEASGLTARAAFLRSDWWDGVHGVFDLVVSNPPYIPSAAIDRLQPEVRFHDPLRALDGGDDGLDAYRVIAAGAGAHVADAGALCVEIGIDQEDDVTALFAGAGLRLTGSRADLGGVTRALLFSP